MIFFHAVKHNKLFNICDNSFKTQRMDLPPEEKPDFDHFIKTHWNVLNVQDNKSLSIGLVWAIPWNKIYFITSLRLSVLTQSIKQIKINVQC